jgi:hypothetical protein
MDGELFIAIFTGIALPVGMLVFKDDRCALLRIYLVQQMDLFAAQDVGGCGTVPRVAECSVEG